MHSQQLETSALTSDNRLTERVGSQTYPRVGWLPDEELRVLLASEHDLHVDRHFIGRGIGYNMSLAVRSHG